MCRKQRKKSNTSHLLARKRLHTRENIGHYQPCNFQIIYYYFMCVFKTLVSDFADNIKDVLTDDRKDRCVTQHHGYTDYSRNLHLWQLIDRLYGIWMGKLSWERSFLSCYLSKKKLKKSSCKGGLLCRTVGFLCSAFPWTPNKNS